MTNNTGSSATFAFIGDFHCLLFSPRLAWLKMFLYYPVHFLIQFFFGTRLTFVFIELELKLEYFVCLCVRSEDFRE